MLKPKSSAIIIQTLKDLRAIPSTDWNSHGLPFKPLFYMFYRGYGKLLFSIVVAYDCFGKLKLLPWQYNGKDMRQGLKERKFGTDKPD